MTARDSDTFWRFSVQFYAMPGVESDCLRLQDEGGLNVNLALWCCWRALEGEKLDREDIRAALEHIGEWNETVSTPLSALRRRVKDELGGGPSEALPHGLYQRLKTAELEAERVEQALLCRSVRNPPRRRAQDDLRHLVEWNLETYMAAAGLGAETPLRAAVPGRFARQMTALAKNF